MCGINGLTNSDDARIQKMAHATAHRGPDATGFFSAPGISFGHNRLSVIDLSERANQPMHSPDARFTLTFNGEIYNYKELRSELESVWNFQTQSDSEVLLAGYATWGKDVLKKLKGIFAFAIWDAKLEELLLVRDHLGVKPLYYALKDDVLYFSSELSGIIAGTDYRTLSQEAFAYYVSLNYVPSPYTLIKNISKLQPAHYLVYKKGAWSIERYWNPVTPGSDTKTKEELRTVIGESVKRQLVSDRPLGVFLSGGLDSSIVLHHTSTEIKNTKTFSVDFEMVSGAETEADKFNSDAALASRTAQIYGADHTTFTLTLSHVRNSFVSALEALDEPIANPTSISQYLLSKWVREKGIVVALGGDGGDELFGGYTRHRHALGASYFQMLPKYLQKGAGLINPQLKKLSTPLGTAFHMQVLSLKPDKYKDLFSSENFSDTVKSLFAARYANNTLSSLHPIDQFMRVDRESWLADESLARTDRTSMAFGVEARVPLLDIDIVNFADSIQGSTKFKPWSSKKILRDAYKGYLPSYLFNQPKRGWISPGAKWLRDPVLNASAHDILSSSYYSGLDGLIKWQSVQDLLTHHTHGGGYHLYPLWNILQLQTWAKKYNITL